MSFTEKCNLIFHVLDCSNADIARSGGIDPSLISRFRTGARQPRATSSQFVGFCKGVISYAQEKGLLEKLQLECRLPGSGNPEDEINTYLTEREESPKNSHKKSSRSSAGLFSEKLNVLMNLLNISNIRLARVLNVDSSLISRFRNGLRTPLKNNSLMESLCSYFYKIARQNELEQELFDLIVISVSQFQSKEEFIQSFVKWFSDENEQYDAGIMDSFLEGLDNMGIIQIPDLPPLSSILTTDILKDQSNEYIGTDGIRQAVIRFLGTVAMSENFGTLKLYSDQNMNWLSSDSGFLQKWAALMYAVLIKKTPVIIIHNINRNLHEMLIGIEKWLPLYMSGLVEGFYRRSHSDPWFSHTLFVAPGTAAICASLATGTEDIGIYHYSDTQERTTYYEQQMNALMENAKPLIKVFKNNRVNDFLFFTGELSKAPGSLKRLLSSPSLATIPSVLLERMLRRSGTREEEIDSILTVHASCVKQFERELENGYVTEYVVFPNDEDLFAGKVMLNLSEAFSEKNVFYTPEEYSEHIKFLIGLLENDHYNLALLPESPYGNIQITVKEDAGAMVQKTDTPVTVFWFSHPLMCKTFSEYIDVIGQRSKLSITGKKELVKYLGKYMR